MHSLPLFHRIDGQPVIVLGEGEAATAKRRLVERAGGRVAGADHPVARLAFVALDEPDQAATALKARGVLVNVVDRPDLCDFTVPSLLDRDPVLVAVGTGGASAGLAKALRLRLETLVPQSLGALATALAGSRQALRRRWPDPSARRRALDAALAEGGALDPLREDSAGKVAQWLEQDVSTRSQTIEIVLSSDDPDDLTLRHARALGMADVVLHDPGIVSAILNRARADAARRLFMPADDPVAYRGLVVILRRG
ncbi:MAG: siroheme synthase [Sphingomonadales bacterium]|nr:siroheme synthase [Sphingomonadales bacterium]